MYQFTRKWRATKLCHSFGLFGNQSLVRTFLQIYYLNKFHSTHYVLQTFEETLYEIKYGWKQYQVSSIRVRGKNATEGFSRNFFVYQTSIVFSLVLMI